MRSKLDIILHKIFGTSAIRGGFERAILAGDYEEALHIIEVNHVRYDFSREDLDMVKKGLNEYQIRLVNLENKLHK